MWDEIDFEGGFVSITKSVEEINGNLRVKATKTAKGRRRIDLSAETLAVLAEQRKVALAAARIASPVFHNIEGGYLRQSNLIKRSFKPILFSAGLPVVSEGLGHSSLAITLDTYSPVLPTMQKRAASVLTAILGTAGKTVRETTR